MKFNLVAPCKDCPFRRDVQGYLHPERAQDILDSIVRQDASFTCHKTISGDRWDEELQVEEENWDDTYRPYEPGPDDQFCAGALIMLEKLGNPNRLPRLANFLGLWHSEQMRNRDQVFESEAEMVAHMKEGTG
ncbi:hypothetical protein SAMN05216548_11446 [Faunimonas pinastri]|uniref:Uncharacterized protein n=1 Tax=Faunimonas pinastri TaxID=1855383 RepID=A0A1H9MTN9_9HYPH|nr:hypothetical protein [Faunimonas pinastri]SER27074.1 hypothetical protein SAMN05216548_11446 [Faunimonas pinastri]